jgi:hypothetical protein
MIHIALHLLLPALLALFFFKSELRSFSPSKAMTYRPMLLAYAVMLSTLVVDLDHLLATTIYDPNRCSIGFHPLHTAIPIAVYIVLCCIPKLRFLGLGLSVHMFLDGIDCIGKDTTSFL